ncbi:hypothetical protein HY218_02340 [Candidatus Saccharibacteria bacterium]|nr:hypothetical protein [Candidatus Saccharibacteria bacterium]
MIDDIKPVRPRPAKPKTENVSKIESAFQPPEEVAAKDKDPLKADPNVGSSSSDPKNKRHWWQLTRKQWIIISIVFGLVLIGTSLSVYWFLFQNKRPKPMVQQIKTKPTPPKPTTEASILATNTQSKY